MSIQRRYLHFLGGDKMYGLTFCGGDNQLIDKITKKKMIHCLLHYSLFFELYAISIEDMYNIIIIVLYYYSPDNNNCDYLHSAIIMP